MVQTVPYEPTAQDNAVGSVPLSDAEANAMASGQMQPGVSLEEGPTGANKPEAPAKPEIPEKFMRDGQLDTDALLKSYQELERKLGQPKEAATDPDASDPQETQEGAEASPPDTNEPDTEAAKEALGEDRFAEYAKKITETGNLDDADFERLQNEHGIPRQMAEAYVQGFHAQVAQARQQLFQQAGIQGEAEYKAIADWAVKNLSQAERDAFDQAVAADNGSGASWALSGLKARYVQANGQAPNLIRGDRSSGPSGGFQSRTEFMDMINSEAYRSNDPGVHAQFQAKLRATPPNIRRAWLGGIDPQTTIGRR